MGPGGGRRTPLPSREVTGLEVEHGQGVALSLLSPFRACMHNASTPKPLAVGAPDLR